MLKHQVSPFLILHKFIFHQSGYTPSPPFLIKGDLLGRSKGNKPVFVKLPPVKKKTKGRAEKKQLVETGLSF